MILLFGSNSAASYFAPAVAPLARPADAASTFPHSVAHCWGLVVDDSTWSPLPLRASIPKPPSLKTKATQHSPRPKQDGSIDGRYVMVLRWMKCFKIRVKWMDDQTA
jgi:hypothetical protein